MRIGATLAALLTGLACGVQPAAAQDLAASLAQLQVLVKPGDSIVVTDSSGMAISGRITELTGSSLRVQSGNMARDFAEADITQITQRRGDPLGNGALIGAFSGLGFGLTGVILICAVEECGWWVVPAVGVYTALGTGIGVGIDALIVRQTTIYRRRTTASGLTLKLVPQLIGPRKGISVSMAF